MTEFFIIMKTLDKRGINMIEKDVINEMNQFQQGVSAYFLEASKHVDRLASDKSIIAFLSSCNKDTSSINAEKYNEVLKVLEKTKCSSNQIFLTFIGIECNGDQIDNFGISRQQESQQGLGKVYEVKERSWYKETWNSETPKAPTITLPYKDKSGSYVISITKGILDKKGNRLGVVGLDVLVRNIAIKLNTKKHIVILTESGEIVYNSETYIKDILEKRHNILLLLEPDVLDIVKSNKTGYTLSKMSSKDCRLGYGCLVQNKYYLITINEPFYIQTLACKIQMSYPKLFLRFQK